MRLLPPHDLRNYVGDGDFVTIGDEFLRIFVDIAGLRRDESILDVGCGVGRIALPLTRYLNANGHYEGFDIVPQAIQWCQENITPRYPNFTFHLADICNSNYNPHGTEDARTYQFPYKTESVDFAIATSVFTHVLPDAFTNYLAEVARVLRPAGRLLMTLFLFNQEVDEMTRGREVRPKWRRDYGTHRVALADVPEATVGYEESFVLSCVDKEGLLVVQPIYYGRWPGRANSLRWQDVILVAKPRGRTGGVW
jgi:SAM-dependent methyltransferase